MKAAKRWAAALLLAAVAGCGVPVQDEPEQLPQLTPRAPTLQPTPTGRGVTSAPP